VQVGTASIALALVAAWRRVALVLTAAALAPSRRLWRGAHVQRQWHAVSRGHAAVHGARDADAGTAVQREGRHVVGVLLLVRAHVSRQGPPGAVLRRAGLRAHSRRRGVGHTARPSAPRHHPRLDSCGTYQCRGARGACEHVESHSRVHALALTAPRSTTTSSAPSSRSSSKSNPQSAYRPSTFCNIRLSFVGKMSCAFIRWEPRVRVRLAASMSRSPMLTRSRSLSLSLSLSLARSRSLGLYAPP